MRDLYLGEILRSRGFEPISEDGIYDQPYKDPIIITFVVDYIREEDYLDVSKLSDQQLYDMVQGYLEHGVPTHLFMEDLEAKYPVRKEERCTRTDCGLCYMMARDPNCPYTIIDGKVVVRED